MEEKMRILKFPEGFLWGAATSAYQVEGANTNNDWWAWEQKKGKIADGSRCGLTSNHYHLYGDDFDLAKELYHNVHRFSLEWSRIEPKRGEWNEEAIEHYRNVLLALKVRGITPIVTLWHFTLPLWVSEMGGFENPEVISLFRRYVVKVCEELGGDTRYWITLNEPMVYLYMGYLERKWPPGKNIGRKIFQVIKNMALAHKEAYDAIHKNSKSNPLVGIAKNIRIFTPYRENSLLDNMVAKFKNCFFNRYLLEKIIGVSDFIGLNYYTREFVRCEFFYPGKIFRESKLTRGEKTDLGWEIYPEGMYLSLSMLKKYNLPIIITENGLADKEDKKRSRFIVDHLMQVHRAIEEGIGVMGYLHWSLIDNFEWAEGFFARFGLAEVDYASQKRTIRDSARTFANISRTNQITL